jgi:UDP-N-acetylmuramyl pentapeptide phosphotransferase/UDP-N-acetylglucosamine-1-phosphate transferase
MTLFILSATFVAGLMLLFVEKHMALTRHRTGDGLAKQASHVGQPLRLGGVAVLVGLIAIFGAQVFGISAAHGPLAAQLLLSVLPVFMAGLLEDFGLRISPKGRLVAAFASSILAVMVLGAWAPRADIWGLDQAMLMPAFAIALTVLFAGGFCHAVNLIDGMNGMAAVVMGLSALGCAAVATASGQGDIAAMALAIVAAMTGFLLLNWPVARLFLGDAGAYGIGHILVWLVILLAVRSDAVAVPALLLLIFWPLADVLHTMSRRAVAGEAIFQPDRMHLHQKIRRMLDIVWLGYRARHISNPVTTLALLPFFAAPVVAGVLLWNRPMAAWLAVGIFALAFCAMHPAIVWLCRRFRK